MLRQGLAGAKGPRLCRVLSAGSPPLICVSGGNRCLPFPFQEFIQFKENNAKLQESRGNPGCALFLVRFHSFREFKKAAQSPQKPRFRSEERRNSALEECYVVQTAIASMAQVPQVPESVGAAWGGFLGKGLCGCGV